MPGGHEEIAGTQAKKAPLGSRHRSGQTELMLQIAELTLQRPVILVCIRQFLVEQARLTEEESLYLKEIIAMFVHRTERKTTCPSLESIAVQSEAEVAREGDEEDIFPIAVETLQPFGDGTGFLLEAFHLEGGQPGMHC